MNFSTPFTCTEIIAHMKTLKYLALASRNQCWSWRQHQNVLILWANLETCASGRPVTPHSRWSFGCSQHDFYFCMFAFVRGLSHVREKRLFKHHANATTKLFTSLTTFWPQFLLVLKFYHDKQTLGVMWKIMAGLKEVLSLSLLRIFSFFFL